MGDQGSTAVKNLGEILTRNAEEIPDRTGVIDRSRRLAWSEIDERTNRLANVLSSRGVRRGDRVASLLQNDPLRHCRRCEFQEICQKFCTKYFE